VTDGTQLVQVRNLQQGAEGTIQAKAPNGVLGHKAAKAAAGAAAADNRREVAEVRSCDVAQADEVTPSLDAIYPQVKHWLVNSPIRHHNVGDPVSGV